MEIRNTNNNPSNASDEGDWPRFQQTPEPNLNDWQPSNPTSDTNSVISKKAQRPSSAIIILLILFIAGGLVFALSFVRSDSDTSVESVLFSDVQPVVPNSWKSHALDFDSKQFEFSIPRDWEVQSSNYTHPDGLHTDVAYVSSDYDDVYRDSYVRPKQGVRLIVRISESAASTYGSYIEQANSRIGIENQLRRFEDVEELKVNGISTLSYVQFLDMARVIYVIAPDYKAEIKYFTRFEYDEELDILSFDNENDEIVQALAHSLHIKK
jgi:hypothetical protein